jgi:POT family proton-dependent oligopeptide transporter
LQVQNFHEVFQMSDATFAQRRKHFFGHPAGLFVLFFAEMWERFSFYGMRALLTLYMVQALLFSDARSVGVYGAYTALVYATPLVGGLLADQILGFKRAVVLGGVLMVFGHATMALDQTSLEAIFSLFGASVVPVGATGLSVTLGGMTNTIETTYFLYTALSFLIIGNGFFKPNISSMVGKLYDAEEAPDSQRDSGFTIFYMGINLGALIAGLLCAWVAQAYGWHYGFGLAALGMVAGLVVFMGFQKWLYGEGETTRPDRLERRVLPGLSAEWAIYIGAFLAVPLVAMLVSAEGVMQAVLLSIGAVVLVGMLILAFQSPKEQRDQIFVILVLILFSTTFWAFFEQAGSSLTLYAERNVDRMLFGWEIPAAAFQSANPAYIIMLAPIFAWMWQSLSKRGLEPRTPVKFGLALLQVGIGFALLMWGAHVAGVDGRVPLIFLLLGYLFHTMGELSMSPVGLSKITQLSPAKLVGVVMGVWFLSSSFANYIASLFAQLAAAPEGESMRELSALETLPIYTELFQTIAIIAIAVGILCLAISPLLNKWMHGVH